MQNKPNLKPGFCRLGPSELEARSSQCQALEPDQAKILGSSPSQKRRTWLGRFSRRLAQPGQWIVRFWSSEEHDRCLETTCSARVVLGNKRQCTCRAFLTWKTQHGPCVFHKNVIRQERSRFSKFKRILPKLELKILDYSQMNLVIP